MPDCAQSGQSQGSEPQQDQGFIPTIQRAFDQFTAPQPHSADQGVLGNAWTGLRNVAMGPVRSIGGAFVHPLQTVGATEFANPAHPLEGFKGPDPLTEMGKEAIAHPIESAEGIAGNLLAGKVGAMGGEGIANLRDPVRAYRSPLIPENEAIARAATDVIKPNPLEYRRMVGNLTTRLPETKEFLQRSGITKPSSPLEFGKGATGAGKEASGYFQENLIKPNADTPAGSSTVGDVYGRVSDINDKLRPMYRAQTMGEQLSKEASDHMQALEQERDKLNGVMYKAISDRSGLPVEQVQDINQRGGQLQSVGDVTDAAQAVRRMGLTHSPGGMLVPMGGLERAMRFVDYARGGPGAVAGRKLSRIMGQINEPPTPLPDPNEIGNNRLNYALQEQDAAAANRQAAQARKPEGMGPTEPLQPVELDPRSELSAREQRVGERVKGSAWQRAQDQSASRAQGLVEQQRLARARELQRTKPK